MSLGIMQFQTTKMISNKTSIVNAIKKLYHAFTEDNDWNAIAGAIIDYNNDTKYLPEVDSIYEEITTYLKLPECD